MYKYDGRRSRTIDTAWETALALSIYKTRLLPLATRPGLLLPGLICCKTQISRKGQVDRSTAPRAKVRADACEEGPAGHFGGAGLPLLCFQACVE